MESHYPDFLSHDADERCRRMSAGHARGESTLERRVRDLEAEVVKLQKALRVALSAE